MPNNSGDILTVAAGGKVSFFDLQSKKLLHSYKMSIHFCNDVHCCILMKKKFVTGGSNLWVRVFDFASGEDLECNKGHHGRKLKGLLLSSFGWAIVCLTSHFLPCRPTAIRCIRYHLDDPDGEIYANGSKDRTIRLRKTVPEGSTS